MSYMILPIAIVGILFVVFPAIIFHYLTQWKMASSMSNEDEKLLDDLYSMARRLDERMDTIERIIAADDPDWRSTADLSNAQSPKSQDGKEQK